MFSDTELNPLLCVNIKHSQLYWNTAMYTLVGNSFQTGPNYARKVHKLFLNPWFIWTWEEVAWFDGSAVDGGRIRIRRWNGWRRDRNKGTLRGPRRPKKKWGLNFDEHMLSHKDKMTRMRNDPLLFNWKLLLTFASLPHFCNTVATQLLKDSLPLLVLFCLPAAASLLTN